MRTIRESPETVYTVSYIDMDEADDEIEKEGIMVPEPEPATPGVTVLDLVHEVKMGFSNLRDSGICAINNFEFWRKISLFLLFVVCFW